MPDLARAVTIEQLLEDKKAHLGLKLLCGQKNLKRKVSKPSVNRPGLALDGHLENYRAEIIQIIGRGEYAFCSRLAPKQLKANFEKMLSTDTPVPCVIITAGMKVLPAIEEACRAANVPLISTHMETSDFCAELIGYLDDNISPRTHLHGVLVQVSGLGVLIRGDAGIGKSECALELLKRGHILVADDVVEVQRRRGKIVGSCPPMLRHYMEVRGLGIIDVELLFGIGSSMNSAEIEMEVNLVNSTGEMDRLGIEQFKTNVLGVDINSLTIPVRPGRNLAVLIEVAALNQRLKGKGISSAKEFSKKLLARTKKGKENGK